VSLLHVLWRQQASVSLSLCKHLFPTVFHMLQRTSRSPPHWMLQPITVSLRHGDYFRVSLRISDPYGVSLKGGNLGSLKESSSLDHPREPIKITFSLPLGITLHWKCLSIPFLIKMSQYERTLTLRDLHILNIGIKLIWSHIYYSTIHFCA
jgi:hypothetical protein